MSLVKKIEAKKAQKAKEERNKKAVIGTVGIVVGTVVGAVTGILLAPKAGKETMEDVKQKGVDVKDKINENLVGTKEKVSESKAKIKEYLESKKAKEEVTIEEQETLLLEDTIITEETDEV